MNLFGLRRQQLPSSAPSVPAPMTPIAVVRNQITRPRAQGWERVESSLILADGLDPAILDGLDGFSHITIVFWLNRLGEDRPRPSRFALSTNGMEVGILASRSQLRPNPIGWAVVRLLGTANATLRVLGLDALDGTPVLDIKPYIPYYDSVPEAVVPPWVYGDER